MAPLVAQRVGVSCPTAVLRKTCVRVPVKRGLVVRAEDDEAAFEARIAALRTAKGAVPYGQSRTDVKEPAAGTSHECMRR